MMFKWQKLYSESSRRYLFKKQRRKDPGDEVSFLRISEHDSMTSAVLLTWRDALAVN